MKNDIYNMGKKAHKPFVVVCGARMSSGEVTDV